MDWRERIVYDPRVRDGKPVIRGTQLTVEHILVKLSSGATEADLLAAYPRLSADDIKACYAFVAASIQEMAKSKH
jgi:uncharacterized protein (DUF433 family)